MSHKSMYHHSTTHMYHPIAYVACDHGLWLPPSPWCHHKPTPAPLIPLAGLYPWCWPLPLTRGGITAAQTAPGDPPVDSGYLPLGKDPLQVGS